MIAPEGAGPWAGPWPGPVDPLRITSRTYRDERHAALARWAGVPEDAVPAFVERLELSWVRERAAEETAAAAQLEAAGRRRARAEAADVIAPPRIRAPRIYAPRLAA